MPVSNKSAKKRYYKSNSLVQLSHNKSWWSLILFAVIGIAFSCEDGWNSGLDHCYLFVNDTKLNWFHAQATCKQNKAELVYIDTKEEQAWLRKELQVHWAYEYWTGLNIPPFDVTLLFRNGQWTWGSYKVVDPALIESPSFWFGSPSLNSGHKMCYGVNVKGHHEELDCNSKHLYACSIEFGGDGACPQDWFSTDRGCIMFSLTDQPRLTWAQAKEKCEEADRADGAHLLTAFLGMALPTFNISTHVFWTGLTTKGNKLVWDNGDTYQPSYIKWETEPDDVASSETCGSVRYNGQFSDRDCNWSLNYICKK